MHGRIAKLIEGRALLVSGINRLLNLVDRNAGDVARVITAILAVAPHGGLGGAAQCAGGCSWRVPTRGPGGVSRSGRGTARIIPGEVAAGTAREWRRAYDVVVVIRPEQAGIEIRISVVPEWIVEVGPI